MDMIFIVRIVQDRIEMDIFYFRNSGNIAGNGIIDFNMVFAF